MAVGVNSDVTRPRPVSADLSTATNTSLALIVCIHDRSIIGCTVMRLHSSRTRNFRFKNSLEMANFIFFKFVRIRSLFKSSTSAVASTEATAVKWEQWAVHRNARNVVA